MFKAHRLTGCGSGWHPAAEVWLFSRLEPAVRTGWKPMFLRRGLRRLDVQIWKQRAKVGRVARQQSVKSLRERADQHIPDRAFRHRLSATTRDVPSPSCRCKQGVLPRPWFSSIDSEFLKKHLHGRHISRKRGRDFHNRDRANHQTASSVFAAVPSKQTRRFGHSAPHRSGDLYRPPTPSLGLSRAQLLHPCIRLSRPSLLFMKFSRTADHAGRVARLLAADDSDAHFILRQLPPEQLLAGLQPHFAPDRCGNRNLSPLSQGRQLVFHRTGTVSCARIM